MKLTRKERQIMELIMSGLEGLEIADKLDITPLTLRSHKKNMFRKFGIDDRYSKTVRLAYLFSIGKVA